jgi:hypothetical protein
LDLKPGGSVLQYKVANLRPYAPSASLGATKVGQTFDEIAGFGPVAGDIIRLVFHGIATYLGIWVGLNINKVKTGNKTTKAVTGGLGWALAAGQGLGAIADVISLGKRALGTHPPEQPSAPVSVTAPIPPVH